MFQQATGYRAPVWPPVEGEQRPMMHFDFQVGDLDSAVAEAVALGASLAAAQPQQNVRVLLDPAGHPFCSAATTANHSTDHVAAGGPPRRGSLRVEAAAAERLMGAIGLDESLDGPVLAGKRGRAPF